MAFYKCETCGMSIGSMTFGTCGIELVQETLTMDDGGTVQVAKCPEGHGIVMSPQCCATVMTCTI